MPIPKRKVHISLAKDTPSQVTPEDLKKDLQRIGLTCKDTSLEKLKKFKQDVLQSWTPGKSAAYGIYTKSKQPPSGAPAADYLKLEQQDLLGMFGYSNSEISGEWTPSDTAQGYINELYCIQYEPHFNKLLAEKPDFFTGVSKSTRETSKESTVEQIKRFFTKIGTELSSMLVDGLNLPTLEALLKNAIGVNESSFVEDYAETGSRVVYLVQNYDPLTQECDAIGVLTMDWALTIRNYQEKKSELKHDTILDMNARAVLYTSIEHLMSDYAYVKASLKQNLFLDAIPPRPDKLKVYDALPPACKDTFLHGLPVVCDSPEYVDTIVLYAPNVVSLYTMDNTSSDASSTYSKSVTSGFTFTTSQSLSAGVSFEVSCKVVKVGFTLGINVSFTEQWNKSVTETVEFTVPAGKIAYAYQGYLQASVLRYYPETESYSYISHAKFLSSSLKTTDHPVE